MQVRVVVDVHERESGVPHALQCLGAVTVDSSLAVGDYQAGYAIVERKTVSDLHLSIIRGRFWRQVARLRRCGQPYVVVEGADIDDGPLRPESVRGALIALGELGVPVMRTHDEHDTALWLTLLARRPFRRRRHDYTAVPPPHRDPAVAMLAAIPGFSPSSARQLLSTYGSVADVAIAGRASWLSQQGIGPKRAAALDAALNATARIPSRGRRPRPDPST